MRLPLIAAPKQAQSFKMSSCGIYLLVALRECFPIHGMVDMAGKDPHAKKCCFKHLSYFHRSNAAQNKATKDVFSVDKRCHPIAELHFTSRSDVYVKMIITYGGYWNEKQCLVADGNKKQGLVHMYRYKCRAEVYNNAGESNKCGLRLQIQVYQEDK